MGFFCIKKAIIWGWIKIVQNEQTEPRLALRRKAPRKELVVNKSALKRCVYKPLADMNVTLCETRSSSKAYKKCPPN